MSLIDENVAEPITPQEDTSPLADLGLNMFSSLPDARDSADAVPSEPGPLSKRMKQQEKGEDKIPGAALSEIDSDEKQNAYAHEGGETSSDQKQSSDQIQRSINDVLKSLGQESKDLHTAWSQSFTDGERFEQFCPTRLDRLIEQATALEQNMQKQKEQLTTRLQGISKVLEMRD